MGVASGHSSHPPVAATLNAARPAPDLIDGFKRAMRHHAGAVTVITTAADRARHGMTATAVTSLTAEPPTLLACMNRSASMHDTLLAAGFFCVNVLAAGQQGIAAAFSTDRLRAQRFRQGCWEDGPAGLPFLTDAHATLFCMLDDHIGHSTHTVLFGRVIGTATSDNEPLVYHAGRYNRLLAIGAADRDPLMEHALL